MSQERQQKAAMRQVIRPRPRSSPWIAALLALAFAAITTPVIMADSWAVSASGLVAGEPASHTVRTLQFSGYGNEARSIHLVGGPIVVERGEMLSGESAAAAQAVAESRASGPMAWASYFAIVFLLGLLYTSRLNRSHRINLLRTQAVTLLLLAGLAAVVKIALLFTAISSLLVPVAAASILAVLVLDFGTGLATALVAALLIGLLSPFDPEVVAVLAAQGVTAAVVVRENERRAHRIALAGAAGGAAAFAAYAAFYYLAWHALPTTELAHPLRSAWVAAAAGGLVSGLLAIPAQPLYQYLLGDITKNKLVELGDLSHPLLVQIANKAPGTWQHSLAMANMAEVAANAIGANGRLVRVGAYYHDLGKVLQPEYYVENQAPGETSPHDHLAPEVSCDAIFSHVTEGVRLGRKHKLPERIIDFIHMHHGDSLLEFFWGRCQAQGNPAGLTPDDFRYPGVVPQSRETAILSICDAVEAASRTLKNPDDRDIQNLVQRIVYGKLHLGQLDESGLGVADLRVVSDSLMETIKHAHHGRVEYPWQKEEARSTSVSGPDTAPERPGDAPRQEASPVIGPSRGLTERPSLDALDAPPESVREAPGGSLGTAPTAPLEADARPAPEEAVHPGDSPASARGAPAYPPTPPPGAADREENADAGPYRGEASAALDATAPALSPRAGAASGEQGRSERAAEGAEAADGSEGRSSDQPAEGAAAAEGSAFEDAGEERSAAARAQSENEELSPGTMVLGPPPKSRSSGTHRALEPEDEGEAKRPPRRR